MTSLLKATSKQRIAQDAAIADHPAADPSSEAEEHDIVLHAPLAPDAQRGHVRVVLDNHRDPQVFGEHLRELHVLPTWEIGRQNHLLVRNIPRDPHPDAVHVAGLFSGSEKDIAPGTGNEWRKMKMSIEKILETPDNPILRKIPLDPKTHQDLIEYAINKAQKAFESEQSILQNSDVKREVEIKRNRAAEEKYRAELSEKYKSRKIEDDEYKLLMQLPLPSEREKFIEALENEFKKGAVPKQLYDKLRLKK